MKRWENKNTQKKERIEGRTTNRNRELVVKTAASLAAIFFISQGHFASLRNTKIEIQR